MTLNNIGHGGKKWLSALRIKMIFSYVLFPQSYSFKIKPQHSPFAQISEILLVSTLSSGRFCECNVRLEVNGSVYMAD